MRPRLRCWRSTGASKIVAALRRAHELDDTVLMFLRQRVLLRRAPDPRAEDPPVRGGAPRPAPDPGSGPLPRWRRGGSRGLRASRQHRPRPDDLDLAGADPCCAARRCGVMDGRSLLGLIRETRRGPRTAESRSSSTPGSGLGPPRVPLPGRAHGGRHLHQVHGGRRPAHRRVPTDRRDRALRSRGGPVPARQPVPGRSGLHEAAIEDTLDARLERLRDCEGIPGRDPVPARHEYCASDRGEASLRSAVRARSASGQHHGIETLTLESPAAGGVEARFAPGAGMVGCSLLHAGEELLGQRDGLRLHRAALDDGNTAAVPVGEQAGRVRVRGRWKIDHPGPDSPRLELDPGSLPIHRLMSGIPGWNVEAHEADPRSRAPARELCVRRRVRAGAAASRFARGDDRRGARGACPLYKYRRGPDWTRPLPVSFGFPPLPAASRRAAGGVSGSRPRYASTAGRAAGGCRRASAKRARSGTARRRADASATCIRPGRAIPLAGGGRGSGSRSVRGYPFAQLYAPETTTWSRSARDGAHQHAP